MSSIHGSFSIFLYCFLSPVLTWLNKFLLTTPECSRNGGYLLVTLFQQASTFLVLTLLSSRFRHIEKYPLVRNDRLSGPYLISTTPIELFPAAICLAVQLTLCNACLQSVSMSSYQVTRSFSIIFSILVNRFVLLEPISLTALISSFIVGLGFFIAVFDGSQPVSYIAIALGILASLAGVLFMSISLPKIRLGLINEIDFSRWIAFDCCIILFPFAIFNSDSPRNLGSTFSLSALISSMLISSLIPLCTASCLRYITPLGCTIAGCAKSSIQTFIGNVIFDTPMSATSLFGVILCLVGCCCYSIPGQLQNKIKDKDKKS